CRSGSPQGVFGDVYGLAVAALAAGGRLLLSFVFTTTDVATATATTTMPTAVRSLLIGATSQTQKVYTCTTRRGELDTCRGELDSLSVRTRRLSVRIRH